MKKYNLILITIDGARLDRLQLCKNFKKISKKGSFFSKMITYGTQTVSSMHAILTGLYGNKNGVNNYFGYVKFKKHSCKTLAQYLQDKGYYIEGDVINEIVLPKQGFNKLKVHDERKADLTERHKKLVSDMNKFRDENQNFFLYLHYSNIHTSLVDSVLKKYTDFDKNYFNNRDKNLRNYDSYIKKADEYLGGILKHLEELEFFKDTIIVVLSDHGASVGEKIGEIGYGRLCYDYTLRTFAVFIQPKIFPVKEVKVLTRTIDIMPTVLDVLGIEEELGYKKIQGESLLPILKGEEKKQRLAFAETAGLVDPYPTEEEPYLKCIRTNKWKLIYDIKTKEKLLFDLETDPYENENIINKNPLIANDLFAELEKLM